jgi:DNA repair protein RecO (recombination protein O)
MLTNTHAIILRTVPFGESSLVVTAFTQVYGLQSYMVKGARSSGKKGQSLRPYLQPGALLSLVVYHQPSSHLQYIREMSWAHVYQQVLTNVVHNSVAVFMVELLTKCIRQSEPFPELYAETEDYFVLLDTADPAVIANLPLHFALWLAGELGFRPENNYSEEYCIFDLKEGKFVPAYAQPQHLLDGQYARLTHQLLSVTHPVTLYRVKLSREQRHELLKAYETYFGIHIEGFGHIRSLEVLGSLFG